MYHFRDREDDFSSPIRRKQFIKTIFVVVWFEWNREGFHAAAVSEPRDSWKVCLHWTMPSAVLPLADRPTNSLRSEHKKTIA